MAAPIAHLFLALAILPKNLADVNVREFIIGTSFPDIRYLVTGIKREDTHIKNASMDMVNHAIAEKKFFHAGMLFHAFVDDLGDRYKDKKNIYKIMPKTEHAIKAIKFLEDNILYDKIDAATREKVLKYFDTVLDEELTFGVSKKYVKRWHESMQIYCEKKMDPQHGLLYYLLLKYPRMPIFLIRILAFLAYWLKILPNYFLKIMEVICLCEKNEKLITRISDFYYNFQEIAKTY